MAISPACNHSLGLSQHDNNNLISSQLEPEFGADPITEEVMHDPVIDQCPNGAHTFERSSLLAMKKRLSKGEPLICPFSRREIDIDRLVVNLFAKDAIERHQKEKQSLDKFERKLAKSPQFLQMKAEYTQENVKLKEEITELKQENIKTKTEKEEMKVQLKDLQAALEKCEKPWETLKEMTWTERGYAVLYPSYYEEFYKQKQF